MCFPASYHVIKRHYVQSVLFFVFIYLFFFPAQPVAAQVSPNDPTFCYAVADNGGARDRDVLIRINRSVGISIAIVGETGTFNVEGMTFVPGGATLYVMENGQLGTLNVATAAFTPIGSPLGTANGPAGPRLINDVDGLAYRSSDNLLYGIVPRPTTPDLLIRIDPATGALVPFAPGVDYRIITITGSPNNFNDVDDLTFDPITGVLYAISDNGSRAELVTINPATGVATFIANFSLNDELEGLSFFNDGELYASSGVPLDTNSNRLYRVDKTNGVLTELGSLLIGGNSDFEAIGCLTATAFLAVEKTTNGVDADLPTGPRVLVGSPVTWAYTVRNTGVVPIDTITLADDMLPSGAISCPVFPQPNQGLSAGEMLTCTASGVATAGQYSNTATVNGLGLLPTSDVVNLTSSDRSHYFGIQTDLAVVKDDGGVSARPGNTLIYTLVYSNAGTSDATGVVLHEQVPANTTFNPTSSSTGWLCTPNANAGSLCTLTLGDVAAGQRGVVNFAVTLIDSFPVGVNTVTNTVTINDDGAHGVDADPSNNQSTVTTPVIAAPELEGDKRAQWQDIGRIGGIDPGEVVTYTIIVRNIGNQDVVNVPLVDTPDVNSRLVVGSVRFTSGTGTITTGNTLGNTTIAATIAAIAGGGEARITYRVTIRSPLPSGVDRIINRALISNTIPLSTTVPAVATPDFVITKSDGGATVNAGATVTYTLVYSNTGNRNATGVVIRETVPEHTTFAAAASLPTLWSCPDGSPAGTLCTTTVGALNAGATGTAWFAVRSNSLLPAGVELLENQARISDDGRNGDDPTPQDNLATDTTPVIAAPDLSIRKTDGDSTATPGATVVYTLTYTNDGTQDATGVTITETVPTYTRAQPAAGTPGWDCIPGPQAGSTCTLTIGSLAAGETGKVFFAVQIENVLPAGVTQVTNLARIGDDGRNGPDLTIPNNTTTDDTPIAAAPDLMIAKDDGGVSAPAGGVITYRLDYNNIGNQDATGVIIREIVPTYTTFTPAGSTAGWLCVPNNNAGSACSINIGNVAVEQPGAVTFAVIVDARLPAGVAVTTNSATIGDDGSNGDDASLDDNQATDQTPLDATPNLTVAKSADLSVVRPNERIRYTLVYTNIGNQDATGVVLREILPEWTTFDAVNSSPGWLCALDRGTNRTICTIAVGNLGAGAQGAAPIFFAVVVNNTIPREVKELLNVVTVADDGANGQPPAGQHSDEVTTPLIQPTDLPPGSEPPATPTVRVTLFLPLVVR